MQIYYEDIKESDELPVLVKHPTPRQLVMWAGASGDLYEIHYDKDFALSKGLKGIIVHGDLTASFLAQLLTDWMGEAGRLKKLQTRNAAMLYPNEDIICKGKVVKKYLQDGEQCIEAEIWAENPAGEKAVTGSAVLILPTRS
ncbi:MaoC/PaaZ C-terminal domain-containing protein [Chloroflexota bacterium]